MEFLSEVKPSIWLGLFGGIFILIGCIFVFVALKQVREDLNSRSWPQTLAVLQDVEVVKRIREAGADKQYRTYTDYYCSLTYEYHADGATFTVQRREPADSREDAVRLSASHGNGETIPIYYKPGQPERHRFELASPLSGLVWLLPFVAFAGFGWAIIYLGNRFYAE